MEETTELKTRKTASEKLEMVESYLKEQQSKAEEEYQEREQEEEEEDDNEKKGKEYDDQGGLIICRLSDNRRVTLSEFKGKRLVSMREYYKKGDKELPTAKGIGLTAEQWATFKKNIPAIEQAIKKMEAR